MKISKRQLKKIIREEKTKMLRESSGIDDYERLTTRRRSQMSAPSAPSSDTPSAPADKARAQEILAEVALFFIYKDENATGAAIYDEIWRRASDAEHEMLDEALEALAVEKGLA